MKIIFSVTENKGKQSIVDARFGRAAGFFLFDEENDSGTWIDNTSNMNAAGGAGVQAAQAVVSSGADVYIGPQLGPKAMSVLSMSKVQLFEGVPGKTVEENIELYKAGKLLKIR